MRTTDLRSAKAMGPTAAARKYDILTALLGLSMQDKGVDGRLAQRLALLITARMNWQRESFAVGVHELARLWAVTDRTAKRELAQMRSKGWISVARAARRGRVTEHRVEMAVVLAATRSIWANVGPDFETRMGQGEAPAETTVVPFPTGVVAAPVPDGSLWAAAAGLLHDEDPALFAAWFANLAEGARDVGRVELIAPTRFAANYLETHLMGRLRGAIARIEPNITRIDIRAD